uniref:Minor capsid protein L2 n=1 Tax=Human papillomavirus TaxID=10566 RepID=A0A385PNU7_9PAPI|nr:MAG: L2 protein [Human papillomavirus]
MLSVKRAKRDTAENLYKQCQITGNCFPDVVNKLEDKTWADTLLQIFSSIIFLGNLGIGTGKGSPTVGSSIVTSGDRIPNTIAPGRTPTVPRQPTTKPARPFAVPLDPIGSGIRPVGPRPVDPSGVRPIDVLDPTSPSIVTLSEALPDNVVTVGEGTLPDLNVTTDTTSINSHPTVFQSPEFELAILNVTPADPPPTRVMFTSTTSNPLFPLESTVGHINPDYDVIVNPFATTETITYGEEIPLEPIVPRQEFDIDDLPKTSTPGNTLQRTVNRFRALYNRNVEQVPTRNVDFLGDVSRAIQFGFENPAFDPEISLEFDQDVSSLRAAPDTDFTGVTRISRPILGETPKGTIRMSRLGSKAGVRTRSGTVAQQRVHYFYDLSRIDNIELSTFADSTIASTDPSTQTTVIDVSEPVTTFPETDLLDTYAEDFDNAHLIIQSVNEEGDNLHIPTPKVTYLYSIPSVISSAVITPASTLLPARPVIPHFYTFGYSVDFDLHPGLLQRRKRKRSDSF